MNNIILLCEFGIKAYNVYCYANDMIIFFRDHRESFYNIWNSIQQFGGTLFGLEFNSFDLKVAAKDQNSADRLQNYFQSNEFLEELNKWLSESCGDSKIEVTEMRKFVRTSITSEKSFEIIRKESEEAMNQGTYHVGLSNSVSCFIR